MTNTMLNEGEAVSRGAMGRQRNPNFSLPIDGAQAQQLMQDLGDEPSMLDEARLDLLEGYTGQVRNQKARDMRSMYTDPVTWWKGEGNDNVADEVKHEIANRRFIANAFGQTTDQQGDLYPSFRDRYFDQTFGKMPANESEAFTMLQKGVTAQQQTEQAIKELPSTLALNLMRAAAGGTEVSEAASYDIYQSWKDRHADVLASLPEDWESKAMEQAETLRSEMDTMMRDIAPEAKKVWDILQKWTRPEKTYTGDKPPEGQGRGPSQQDTSVANDTPVSREDVEGVAKALTEMPEEKQKRLLEMLYMSAEATGAGMGRGFFEKIGEGLVRGGVRIYEEGVMASEDRTARYNLTRLKRGETLYEMADGVVGTKEEIARLASSGNYNATKLLTDPSFQAGTGNVNDERRSQLLDANEQRLRELSTLRKIRSLAEGGIDPLKTEMTGIAGSVVQGAYDYSQSAGYTVMAAVPFVGFPAVTISLANSNYLRMLDEYPDIDPDFAWNASLAIGAPQAFIERFKVNALMGRSPMLNKLIKRMTDARVPLGVRIGLAYGANVAYQTGQEFLQEAMPTVADQLSAALREDMPEFDANQAWGAYVDQMPQIFYSMLWAGLIGTGAVSLREFKRDGIFLTNVGELEMVGIVGDTARDIAAEQDTDARNEKIKTAWGQRSEADIKAGIAKRAAMLQAANVNDTRAGMPQRDSVELQDGTVQHTIRDSEGNVLLKTTDPLAADVAYIGMVRQIASKEFNNETAQLKELTEWWLTADPTRADNEQRQLRDTDQGTAQQKLEALQQANNEQGIAELHRRIAQSPYAGTPYDQIQILGEASVEQVGDMVFRSVIALNKNSRVRDAREEMHHTAVRMAVANGKVDEQTMRGWLEATERVFAEKGLNTPLPRADMTDIVESMAVVQEAFENERISADVEMSLPQAFVDYIKRMIQVLVEVLKRGKAIREALDAGVLPAELEGFLAMTTGVSQQEIVDRARERTEQDMRGEDGLTDVERRALQIALQEDMEQDAFDALRENGTDILDAVREAGGLPSMKSSKVYQYAGELKRIREAQKGGNAIGVKATFNLFRKDAPDLDALIKDLQSYGFSQIKTPSDLFDMIEQRIATGRPIYGYEAASIAAQMDNYSIAAGEAQRGADVAITLENRVASSINGVPRADIFESAKRRFGVTQSLYEAGYVLPDGTMLDFSGRADAGFVQGDDLVFRPRDGERDYMQDQRGTDHREVEWDDMPRYTEIWASMTDFLRLGAIRIDGNSGMISMHSRARLTSSQARVLKDLVVAADGAYVDLEDDLGNKTAMTLESAKWPRVKGLLERWANGETPAVTQNYSIGLRPDVISQVSDRDDGSRVGTAKLGTDKVPVDTPQTSNISGDTVPQDLLAKQMAKVDYAHLPDSIRNESDPKKKRRKLINWFKKNLLALHDAFPEEVRARATHWYDGANRIAREFGQRFNATVEQASGVIAVFSPQKDWFMNVAQAMQFMELWTTSQDVVLSEETVRAEVEDIIEAATAPQRQKRKKAPDETKEQAAERKAYNQQLDQKAKDERRTTLDKIIGKTVRELDDQPYLQGWAIRVLAQVTFGRNYRNISPEGEMLGMATNDDGALAKNGWGSINEIEKAVRIMKDGALANISNNLGNEHKVRNFYNNIVAPNSGFGDATIDTHAVAAAHLMPYGAKATEVQHNFGSGMNSSDAMGVSGLYHVYLDAYREAAKERGLQPRQLQSITWEAIRLVYPAANKNAATLAKAAQTWNSLSDGRARNSLVGGTIPNPVWAGTGNVAESQSLAGSTEGDGQGSDAGRGLRAGDRSDGRQGVDNYSISTQSEIDRVQKAMDRLARSPSERISQYAALKERLAAALERNQPIMQSMRGDTLPQDFDRTRLLNDLGFLDYILKVLPPEVRGRVGGYTNLAAIAPVDVYKGDQKVSEAKNPAGAIISAWMREGQNIGQAQKNTALPEGYSTVANTTDERRDKTVANFFIDRLKKIDRELERYYKRDLMERIFDVLDKSRPKAGQSGVKRSTLGPETQKFADMVYRSSLLDDEKTAERLTAIEAQITGIQPRDSSPEAFAESQKRISELSEEWTIVNTFGDLKSRPSETLAYGLEWLQGQLKAGRSAWQIKEAARIQENRERAAKVVAFLGKPTDVGRFENKSTLQRFLQAVNAYDLDHKSFEQFAPYLFGDEVAAELSKKMQRAQIDEAKAELNNTRLIIAALREGAKAAGTTRGRALALFKDNQPKAVRKLQGRKVRPVEISIELAKKIVRGLADRSNLSQADVQTLADELAALPRDTRKENVTIQQVIFRGEEVRLTMSRAQAMQLWLTWQQTDAQEKMRADGFTDDSFDDLDNLISDPFSQAILRVTQRIYGSGYPLTNPVYARMFGMNMPMVKNYAPARYQSNKDVKDVGLDGSPLTAGGQPSFAKSRVNHTAKLAPEDALTVLQSHIAMQSHFVAFAEVTREYRSLLSNPDVREAIRQRLGKDVLRSAEMWGDQMEQRGGNKGREIAWIQNMLGAVIGGQSVSLLGYNLKSLMMQTDNFMRFFLALDSRQIGSALSDPVALMQSVRKVWKTDIIQTRLEGGATAETRFFFERFVSMFRRGAKVAEMSMMPMNYLDSAGLSISGAVVYQAAYKDALDSGVDPTSAEQVAKDAVEAMIYRYGQPVLMGQKSNIENSGNAFTKAFFLFMSDPRLKMAIISDSVRGLATGRGDWKAHVRRIVAIEMMAVVAHVLATAFRDATSDDDDEDLWSMGGFARALLLAPFQGYFLVGSVSDLVLTRLTEAKWFTPTQNPLIRTADTAMRAFNNIDDAFNFDDPDALVKEWTNITRSIAVTPPLAAPAVIMNLVRPLVQGWEHMVPSIMDKMDGGWKDERVQQDDE